MEQWKPIPDYEGFYEVSDHGRVRSRFGRVLRAVREGGGYLRVDLSKANKQRTRLIHQLVLLAFVGPPDGLHVRHKNGIRNDNRLENLHYGTISENALDRSDHGRGIRQEHPMAILTDDEVRDIKAWPFKQRGIYKQWPQVSRATIDAIRSGRNWKSLV